MPEGLDPLQQRDTSPQAASRTQLDEQTGANPGPHCGQGLG